MPRKYGPKASQKVARTMHEFKRGKLKSGSGGKVTSREQAIAIGISQARRAGYKVPDFPAHATMTLDMRVQDYLARMRPGEEIDARGIARALGGVDPLEADYALERAVKARLAVTSDGKWFGPAGASSGQARATRKARPRSSPKSPAQLEHEISEMLAKRAGSVLKSPEQLEDEISEVLAKKSRRSSAHATKRPTPYRLLLSPSERSAVDFASGRCYAWPDMLSTHSAEDGAVAFTESEMWQWTDDVDSDTEGGHDPFPLASPAFAEKLQRFYDSRV
jgi:hypothetical protein